MKKFVGNKFVVGVAALLIGLVLLFFPEQAISLIMRVIGIILLAGCAIRIVAFINGERTPKEIMIVVLMGLLIVFAILLLICPAWIVKIASYLLGAMIIAIGIWYIIHAIRIPGLGSFRYVLIGIAVVSIVLGILVITNPFGVENALARFAGFSFLVSSVQSFLAVAADQKNAE